MVFIGYVVISFLYSIKLMLKQVEDDDPQRDQVDHVLSNDSYPSKVALQRLHQCGMATIDSENGIAFRTDMSHSEVMDELPELLPVVFDELDCFPDEVNYDPKFPDENFQCPLVVLCQEHHKAVVVPGLPYFNGSDLQWFSRSSSQRNPFRDCTLLLCMWHFFTSEQ